VVSGIGSKIEVALVGSFVLAVGSALFSPLLTDFAWWILAADIIVLATIAIVLSVRERRLRRATERVLGRALNPQEPIATAWLRWAKMVRDQLRAANRERQDIAVVLENMGEGILVLDEQQAVKRINAAGERLLNVKRDAVVGRHFREALPQQDLVRFIGSILVEGSRTEVDITLSEADARYLQASGQLLVSEGRDAPAGIVVVLNEVTRLRRLERARRDFVANVSHELKTPITSIQGFVETLLDGAIENREDTARFLGIIQRQSERLGQIFNDMLSLSRIESEQDLEVAPADLFTLARSVVGSLEWKARERNVALLLEGESVPVMVNGQLIEQALTNLVDNAIKYGAAAGKQGRVRVSVTCRDGAGIVAVEDNGAGIEPQHLPRIFERFYRVDKGRSRSEGGTGLGLAIVKHIAQAHGGQATVMSEPNVRTVFEISIPLQAA
jgi:two-component system phosphate regulon sensor histidine kinase PhoR